MERGYVRTTYSPAVADMDRAYPSPEVTMCITSGVTGEDVPEE